MSSAPTQNCIHCGYEIALGALTCPYCRGGQAPGSSPPVFPRLKVSSRYVYEERPAGVTALGVLTIFAGLATLALAPVIHSASQLEAGRWSLFGPEQLAGLGPETVVVLVVLGLVAIALGVGLLFLRQWARIACVILAGLSAVLGIVGIMAEPMGFDGYLNLALGLFIGIYLIVVGPYFGKRAVQYVAKAPRR